MSTLRSQNPNPSCSSIPNPTPATQPSLLVFSGGTAFNGVVEDLKTFTTRVAHVLPVSADGGSTAEIVRVLGGPAVGDIRSMCLRLADKSTSEAGRPSPSGNCSVIVYRSMHAKPNPNGMILWKENTIYGQEYQSPIGKTIRAFLVYFQNQILRRSDESFCFSNGRSMCIFSVFGCCNIFVFSSVRYPIRKSGSSSDFY